MRLNRSVSGKRRKNTYPPDEREDEDLFAAPPEEVPEDDLLDEPGPEREQTDENPLNQTVREKDILPSEAEPDEAAVSGKSAEPPLEDEELDETNAGPDGDSSEEPVPAPDSGEPLKRLSGEWIDQKFNGFVDRAVVRVPAFFRLTGIRIARQHAGWHIWLILVSFRNAVSHLLGHFRSEDDMDLFLDDTAEHLGDRFSALKSIFGRQMSWLVAIDTAGDRLRFALKLFFIALSACGCALIGTWELASLAFLFGVSWLSTAFDLSYKPVIGRLRQVYIGARLLSALSMLIPAMMYYIHYQSRGGANNMMLQGMLIFTLLTHLVLFTVVVLPNRQQSLFLRVLSGVLGIIPALLVANVVSYSASIMGMGTGGLVGGILRILGAMLLFISDRLESLYSLGSLRFMFSEFFLVICELTGGFLLLMSAWVFSV